MANKLTINVETCVGCGVCVNACPVDHLELVDGKAQEKAEDNCVSCGVCVNACPVDAIVVNQ
jgi:NAD-dependent dihydropyrimidine dehydrogenase PreA subunit